MPRASELRTNFTAGELSNLINARTNFSRFFNGSATVENFIVLPQGPLFRRKGFKFVGEVKDSSTNSILIPFEFSASQTYTIEAGDTYFRFFSSQARLLEDSTVITGVTQANPAVVSSTAHPYANGDLIVIQDIVGMTELNTRAFTIANKTTNTYQLEGVDSTSFGSYVSGGTASKVHTITTPYLASELNDIKFVQDSDVMYLVHPNHPVQKLIRESINSFTINDANLIKGPFVTENIISTDLLSLTGGAPWSEGSTLTMTASGGHTPFTVNHIGSLWKIEDGADTAYVKVTGFTSSTVVTVIARNDVVTGLRGIPKFTWSEGEFSVERGFPSAITFHEQRLVLSGAIGNPQKIFFSNSNADYENFESGIEDDDAFNIKIAVQKGDPIRWLFSDEVLFIGTSNGVFRATSSANGSIITPSDIDVKKQISYGSSRVQPQLVGNAPIYIQKAGNKARGISFGTEKYGASDLTVDSDHITESSIKQTEYQQDPVSSLWCVRNDGQVAVLTVESDQDILSWHRFTTQGNFESIAIINGVDDNDEVYAIVKRTINGVTKRFIEIQEPNYLVDNLNRTYVDSFLTYDGTQTIELTLDTTSGTFTVVTEGDEVIILDDGSTLITEDFTINIQSSSPVFSASDVGKEIHEIGGKGRALIVTFVDSSNVTVNILENFTNLTITSWAFAITYVSGLDHLIGETVSICSDGATVKDQVVDVNGAITLDFAGAIIHVGLPYISTQKNMPIEVTALSKAIGSTQHKTTRIDTVVLSFQDTNGGRIFAANNTIDISARSTFDSMNITPPLFEGDINVTTIGSYEEKGQISILQDGPQPMTIKSITYKTTVNDK